MKVVTIPTIGAYLKSFILNRRIFVEYLEEKSAESTADAKIYNEITTIIPPESISIPLILHGILEQVEAQIGNSSNINTSNQQDDVGRYLHEKLMTLSMGKEQQKVSIEYNEHSKEDSS